MFFTEDGWVGEIGCDEDAIIFKKTERERIYNALFRGTNTLSPPDHDLIKLLEDMKK